MPGIRRDGPNSGPTPWLFREPESLGLISWDRFAGPDYLDPSYLGPSSRYRLLKSGPAVRVRLIS
jgi:hypothetical protein